VVSTPGIAQDLEPSVADLRATLALTANTTKPLVLLVSEEKLFVPVLDLLENLHGDSGHRPAVIPYFNPITPLVLNAETSRKMAITVERGLPFIYNNYGMSGATAPITPGSTLVVAHRGAFGGAGLYTTAQGGRSGYFGKLAGRF
jgi:trimethylamine:corrinoid methyltransferase-like protein